MKIKAKTLVFCLILAIPFIWGVYIISRYGVNVCVGDEWEHIRHRNDFLSVSYLWAQHNEHRMLFPNMVTYVFGRLFNWNSKVFMYVGLSFLLILYCVVLKVFFKDRLLNEISFIQIIEAFALGMTVFNLCQYQNLLWGFQIAWFMIVSFGVLSFYCFSRYLRTLKPIFLCMAMACAMVSSYSSMHGLAVWGAYFVILVLIFAFKEKIPRQGYLAVFASGVFTVALYFRHYYSIAGHTDLLGQNIDEVLSYAIAQIGANLLSSNSELCFIVGFIFVIYTVALIIFLGINKHISDHFTELTAIVMGYGMVMMVSFGRSGGFHGGIASRYTTNSMLIIVFSLLLAFKMLDYEEINSGIKSKCRMCETLNRMFFSVTVLICLLAPFFIIERNFGEIKNAETCYESRIEARNLLIDYRNASTEDISKYLYPVYEDNQQELDECFEYLENNKLNAFIEE